MPRLVALPHRTAAALIAIVLAAAPTRLAGQQAPGATPTRPAAPMPVDSIAERRKDAELSSIMFDFSTEWSRMAAGMLGATHDYLARPETAAKLATFTRNYVDALVARGFSRDEALRLASSVQLPLSLNGR